MGQYQCSATTLRRVSSILSRVSTTGIVIVYVQYAYMIYNRRLRCVLRRHAHTTTCHHVPPHTAPRVCNRAESRLKQHGLLRGTFNFKEWADTVLDPELGGLGCGSIPSTKMRRSCAHILRVVYAPCICVPACGRHLSRKHPDKLCETHAMRYFCSDDGRARCKYLTLRDMNKVSSSNPVCTTDITDTPAIGARV